MHATMSRKGNSGHSIVIRNLSSDIEKASTIEEVVCGKHFIHGVYRANDQAFPAGV